MVRHPNEWIIVITLPFRYVAFTRPLHPRHADFSELQRDRLYSSIHIFRKLHPSLSNPPNKKEITQNGDARRNAHDGDE